MTKKNYKKKGVKAYLLEGLMIFLAVTLGFLAESLREDIADDSVEKELILSMIEDAKTDTTNFKIAIDRNTIRSKYLDTLMLVCYSFEHDKLTDFEIYKAFYPTRKYPDLVSPTQRTLAQLKNTGSMRLLKMNASNAIMVYDDFGVKLLNQQSYYEHDLSKMLDYAPKVFNFSNYPSLIIGVRTRNLSKADVLKLQSAKLLSRKDEDIKQLGNLAYSLKGKIHFYISRLEDGKKQATELINVLKAEYDLL